MRYLALLFLFCITSTYSQDNWYKEYHLRKNCNEYLFDINLINDSIYLIGNIGCVGSLGGGIYKLDMQGTVIDTFLYTNYEISYGRALVFDNREEQFLFTGFKRPSFYGFIAAVDLEGEMVFRDSITYGDEYSGFDFAQGILPYEFGFIVYGITDRNVDRRSDEWNDGILTFLNRDYSVDTSYILDEGIWGGIGSVVQDSGGQLWAVMQRSIVENFHTTFKYYLTKISRDSGWDEWWNLKELKFTGKRSDLSSLTVKGHYPFIYHSHADMFVSYDGYSVGEAREDTDFNVHAFDRDGRLLWEVDRTDYEKFLQEGMYIDHTTSQSIIECSNGDIVLTGYVLLRDISHDWEKHYYVPFVIRISSTGEILFFRMIYINPEDGIPKARRSINIVEMDNGEFLLSGNYLYTDGEQSYKPFLMTLSADGCFNETNCGLVSITTKQDEIPNAAEVMLYPNPSDQEIRINYNLSSYSIHGLNGEILLKGSEYQSNTAIDVIGLSKGWYIFIGRDDSNRVLPRSFLVK